MVFVDDVTADRSSSINSEVHKIILSTEIQPNVVMSMNLPQPSCACFSFTETHRTILYRGNICKHYF